MILVTEAKLCAPAIFTVTQILQDKILLLMGLPEEPSHSTMIICLATCLYTTATGLFNWVLGQDVCVGFLILCTTGERRRCGMTNVQGLSFSHFNVNAGFSLVFNLYHIVIRDTRVLWEQLPQPNSLISYNLIQKMHLCCDFIISKELLWLSWMLQWIIS